MPQCGAHPDADGFGIEPCVEDALGRFIGTLLSGLLYQWGGLLYALIGSAVMLLVCWLATLALPLVRHESAQAAP